MRKANTIAALVLIALTAGLAGCGDKAAADAAAAHEKAQDQALQLMLKQCGNTPASGPADCKHTVRKPGESGMKGY